MSTTHTTTPSEIFCCRCRAKKPIKNAQHVTLKNGKPAVKATCGECATSVFTIVKGASKK